MVKRDKKMSISEDDEKAAINENGKRPTETQEKDQKRLKTRNLYRQPTVSELSRLQETENLFNSNLFRLQIEEILEEVKLKDKIVKRFQEWFNKLKDHLLSIPEDDSEYDLTEDLLSKRLKATLPISKEVKKTKCLFKFHKFNDVKIVGSYALGNSINSKLVVDLNIMVPADTYTKNDSINYRYHKKRAAYMAFIASHLNNTEIIDEIKYTWLYGCKTKPVIDIKPNGKLGKSMLVRIDLLCESEAYKLHRFSPLRNNLREAWLLDSEKQDSTIEVGPATPYYNSSILRDLTAEVNEKLLCDIFENCENLKQAVVLLKIWLRQRKLQVSGYIISMFVAYLVQAKRINNIMSSYQIVRNVWIALKSSEWDTTGVSLNKGSTDIPSLEEFLQHFSVVFIDITGYYNICWQMHKGTYYALRRECSLAIEILDNPKINSFLPLFMVPVQPITQFDHILRFRNLPKLKESVMAKVPKESKVNCGIDQLFLVTDTIYSLLTRGLGNRIDLILQMVEADFSWTIDKTPEIAKKAGFEEKLSFGLILNTENVMNIVDRGPPANLQEAEEFRSFWGDKSELRRFQDGSITEACVWTADTLAERRSLPKQIIDYLFNLKYGVPPSQIFHVCNQLDSLLVGRASGRCEEGSVAVLRAFDELRKDMRALTQLPLDVSSVYGISPVFSYSEPVVGSPCGPEPQARRRGSAALVKDAHENGYRLPNYTPANTAVVELGHSGKWPGDIEAFRCLKAAFNLQIADRLNKQYSLPTQAYPTHIDVLKNGLVFRLQIAHPKEITLLLREIQNGVVRYKESEESVSLQRDTVLLPRLRGALHGLHQKHPSFGPSVCLFKRWLCAHLLSPPHFPATLAELVVAAVFVRPAPLEPPTQAAAGLYRALHLLATTDWASEMILLDFNNDMTHEEIVELERKFSERDSRAPCMYVVTSYDGDLPAVWGRFAPTRETLARAQALAKATLNFFEIALLTDFKDNVLGAFVPSLSGYDVILKLQPRLVPHAAERVDRPARLRRDPDAFLDDHVPVVEFNPVEKYLHDLRSAYSEYALFFHDAYGGEVVAVLWRPGLDDLRDLQIGNANALTPVAVGEETKYRVDKEALVEDFRRLGRGLVKDVTVAK